MSSKFLVFLVVAVIMTVLFGLALVLKCNTSKMLEEGEKEVVEYSKSVEAEGASTDVIQYRRGKCLIINRLACPPGWGPISVLQCEEKLDKCQGNYEALQKFCNVNCQEDLEACLLDLQYEKELRQSDPYLGYYP